jgi:hypothetical protein
VDYAVRRQWYAREYLCFLDESESGKGVPDPFFVYGALLFALPRARELHNRIVRIRDNAGIPPNVPLKWHMGPVAGVSQDELDRAKSQVIQAVCSARAQLFVSLVHRGIAVGQKSGGKAHEFGANTVLQSVGESLEERHGSALFLFDRLSQMKPDQAHEFLARRMTHGLGHEDEPSTVPPALGFGFVNSKSTRLGSALDVSMGAFVRCLRRSEHPFLEQAGASAVSLLARGQDGSVWGRGLNIRPTLIRSAEYASAYQRALDRLRGLGLAELETVKVVAGEKSGFVILRV